MGGASFWGSREWLNDPLCFNKYMVGYFHVHDSQKKGYLDSARAVVFLIKSLVGQAHPSSLVDGRRPNSDSEMHFSCIDWIKCDHLVLRFKTQTFSRSCIVLKHLRALRPVACRMVLPQGSDCFSWLLWMGGKSRSKPWSTAAAPSALRWRDPLCVALRRLLCVISQNLDKALSCCTVAQGALASSSLVLQGCDSLLPGRAGKTALSVGDLYIVRHVNRVSDGVSLHDSNVTLEIKECSHPGLVWKMCVFFPNKFIYGSCVGSLQSEVCRDLLKE